MRLLAPTVLFGFVFCGVANAEGVHAVRPLPGYTCMQLAAPSGRGTGTGEIPIRDAPSLSARIVSYAANTMIVEASQPPVSGFLRVLRFTGEQGWIQLNQLRPWSNPYAPNSKCTPSVMSDGKPGFGSAG